jgi:hypothetical protein
MKHITLSITDSRIQKSFLLNLQVLCSILKDPRGQRPALLTDRLTNGHNILTTVDPCPLLPNKKKRITIIKRSLTICHSSRIRFFFLKNEFSLLTKICKHLSLSPKSRPCILFNHLSFQPLCHALIT